MRPAHWRTRSGCGSPQRAHLGWAGCFVTLSICCLLLLRGFGCVCCFLASQPSQVDTRRRFKLSCCESQQSPRKRSNADHLAALLYLASYEHIDIYYASFHSIQPFRRPGFLLSIPDPTGMELSPPTHDYRATHPHPPGWLGQAASRERVSRAAALSLS